MKTYTFYHIIGVKIGCTISFKQRVVYYTRRRGYKAEDIVVLEVREFASDEEAGDYEKSLADQYGYKNSVHYKYNWSNQQTKEQRSEIGKVGGKAGGKRTTELGKSGFQTMTKERLREVTRAGAKKTAELGKSGFQTMTMERRREVGKLGGAIAGRIVAELGTGGFQKRVICPHCQKEGRLAAMYRWHFNRCKFKPQ